MPIIIQKAKAVYLARLTEKNAEDESHKRSAEHQLPEESHRIIRCDCRKPYRNEIDSIRPLEEKRCPETHQRTHHRYSDSGSESDEDNLAILLRRYIPTAYSPGNRICYEERHHKTYGNHDCRLMSSPRNIIPGKTTADLALVVNFHRKHHDEYHQNGEHDSLEQCFRHNTPPKT